MVERRFQSRLLLVFSSRRGSIFPRSGRRSVALGVVCRQVVEVFVQQVLVVGRLRVAAGEAAPRSGVYWRDQGRNMERGQPIQDRGWPGKALRIRLDVQGGGRGRKWRLGHNAFGFPPGSC